MNRTDARILTLQSINTKTSELEQNLELVSEAVMCLDGWEDDSFHAVKELTGFASSYLLDSSMSIEEAATTVAAFITLALQLRKEER